MRQLLTHMSSKTICDNSRNGSSLAFFCTMRPAG